VAKLSHGPALGIETPDLFRGDGHLIQID